MTRQPQTKTETSELKTEHVMNQNFASEASYVSAATRSWVSVRNWKDRKWSRCQRSLNYCLSLITWAVDSDLVECLKSNESLPPSLPPSLPLLLLERSQSCCAGLFRTWCLTVATCLPLSACVPRSERLHCRRPVIPVCYCLLLLANYWRLGQDFWPLQRPTDWDISSSILSEPVNIESCIIYECVILDRLHAAFNYERRAVAVWRETGSSHWLTLTSR